MTFGSRLRQIREQRGLTQGALGKGLGTNGKDASKASVSDWEKDAHFPKVDQLILICDRLNISADYLLNGKQAADGLSPEVVVIAREIEQLPGQRRDQMIRACRAMVDIAKNGEVSAPDFAPQRAAKG